MDFPLTIAYNMADKKVGCVLLQPIMGASFPGSMVAAHFDSHTWELSPNKLDVYTVNTPEELQRIVSLTHQAHKLR